MKNTRMSKIDLSSTVQASKYHEKNLRRCKIFSSAQQIVVFDSEVFLHMMRINC